jgi:uncharacterized membrane protein
MGSHMKNDIKLILVTLKRILTLKRFLLIILFSALSGFLMAKLFPVERPWYIGALYGLVVWVSVKLAFLISPYKPDEADR